MKNKYSLKQRIKYFINPGIMQKELYLGEKMVFRPICTTPRKISVKACLEVSSNNNVSKKEIENHLKTCLMQELINNIGEIKYEKRFTSERFVNAYEARLEVYIDEEQTINKL